MLQLFDFLKELKYRIKKKYLANIFDSEENVYLLYYFMKKE